MSEEKRELTDFEKDVQLAFKVASEEMKKFAEIDHVEVDYASFVRSGLPIIHGILKGSIEPAAWLHYLGGSYQELWVYNGDALVIKIPPIFEPQPTAVFDDLETPSFFNFVAGIGLNRKDNPEEFERALSLRLQHSFTDLPPNVQLLVQLNTIFEKNGFSRVDVSDFVVSDDVTSNAGESELPSTQDQQDNKGDVSNDSLDEGELL